MPNQPGRSETDTTQPTSPAEPDAQPVPPKRKSGEPLVPRDTRPDKSEQNEPPVEDV